MARLGGSSFVITPGQGTWQLETRLGAVMDGDARRAHARRHPGARLLLRRARHPRLRRRHGPRGRPRRDRASTPWRALVDKPLINLESAINHPCQALADWKTLDELAVPRARASSCCRWVNHPRALPLAVPAAAVHMAAHARHGSRGAAPRRLRAAAAAHGQGARSGRGASGGSVTRDQRPRRGARAARTSSTPRSGAPPRHYGDAAADAQLRAAAQRLVRATTPGSRSAAATASSCTACRCAATSRSPTTCSTARAASCCARPTTACRRRWPCCTACSVLNCPRIATAMIMHRADQTAADPRAAQRRALHPHVQGQDLRREGRRRRVRRPGRDARADRADRDPAPPRHPRRAGARRRPAAHRGHRGAGRADAHGAGPARHRREAIDVTVDGAERPDQHAHPRRSAATSTSTRSASAAWTPA